MKINGAKMQRISRRPSPCRDLFNELPDDLVLSVLCKLSSSASSPSDLIAVRLTCRRLNVLAVDPLVLSKAGYEAFAVRARNWSPAAHRFLEQCVYAGNVDGCYALGMILFYCLENREAGQSLMVKAAVKSHAPALYSLAVIRFNGSGGSRSDRDLRSGVALCFRAASLFNVDALREIGHCLRDGYGISQSTALGCQVLIEANVRELSTRLPDSTPTLFPLLDSYSRRFPSPEVHPVNQFLIEWFSSGRGELADELRLCAHKGCGRPETRAHEFRRCSLCGTNHYCSRSCQALDWRLRHQIECAGGRASGGGGRDEAMGRW